MFHEGVFKQLLDVFGFKNRSQAHVSKCWEKRGQYRCEIKYTILVARVYTNDKQRLTRNIDSRNPLHLSNIIQNIIRFRLLYIHLQSVIFRDFQAAHIRG